MKTFSSASNQERRLIKSSSVGHGIHSALIVIFHFTLIAMTAVSADELERIEPQPVPESARPERPGAKSAEPVPESDEGLNQPAGVDLKGVVFFARRDQLNPYGLYIDENADIPENELLVSAVAVPALQDPAFQERLKPYQGVALTQAVIEKLKQEVIRYYHAVDRPFVSVSIPPQDVTSGVIQVLVLEARIGRVSVQGNKWFNEEQYLSALRLEVDEKIDINRLNEDMAWINRNPFRTADVVTEAGAEYGQSDITLIANERFPVRLYGGFDNYGTERTGKERFLAGFNWGNALGLGHELNYQHSRSVESNLSRGHAGSYVIPLPWRHIFSISAAYSKINPEIAFPFDSEGKSWSMDLAYMIPLKSSGNYSHQFSARIPFKSADNNLEFAQIPVTDNETHVLQAEITYGGRWQFGQRQLGFNLTVVGSPGSITGRNEDRFFDISRAGATADYGILRAGVTFTSALPRNFRWTTGFNGQLATGNLLGSEQIGLAGVGAVRGYNNSLVYTDEGFAIRNELIAPPFSLLELITGDSSFINNYHLPRDTMSLYAFLDAANGSNVDLLPGEPENVSLVSTGIGMRYALGSLLTINLDYGWQLTDDPAAVRDTSSQLHASITIGY